VSLQKKNLMVKEFKVSQIEAVTISLESSEFVLHIKNSEDMRLSSYNHRSDIISSFLSSITKDNVRLPLYYINEISLQNYERNNVDVLKKIKKRPDDCYKVMMNNEEFLIKEKELEKEREKDNKDTQVLFTSNKKTITKSDFELLKNIGKGAHGKVLLCEEKFGKKELYAMKILKKSHIIEKNQLEHTKAEKIVLSHVNHPFLISLKHSFQSSNKIYFIMEFMKGGELFQHLKRVKQFSEEETKFIAGCVILALGHLHNKNYIYRDLKPENVLLDCKGYAKLTDFGLAKFIDKTDVASTFCGTPEYMAPEVILGKGCNRPADWWSLGVLLYEMIFGIPPFYSTDVQTMYKRTIVNKLKFKKYSKISVECEDFLRKLLMKKPNERLGSMADSLEVMSHPWFLDFDWQLLMDKRLEPVYNPMKDIKNWEDNFDPCFLQKKPTDSISYVDSRFIKEFEKDFEEFDFNINISHNLVPQSTPETTDNSKHNTTKEEKQIKEEDNFIIEEKSEKVLTKKSSTNLPFKTPSKNKIENFESKKKLKNYGDFKTKQKTNRKLEFEFDDKSNTYQKNHRSPFKFSTILFDCKISNK
jgi:serum/glucocorticoid-regulated kinase 2